MPEMCLWPNKWSPPFFLAESRGNLNWISRRRFLSADHASSMSLPKDNKSICHVAHGETELLCPFTSDGASLSLQPFSVNITDYSCSLYNQCCCPPAEPDIEMAGTGVSFQRLPSRAM